MKSKTRKNFLNKYSIIIILIIFSVFFHRITYTKAQTETTVLGIDSAEDLEAGSVFVLSIYLVNVSKTTGVGLDLTWNPSVLSMQMISINPSAPENTTLFGQKIDNDVGSLKFALINTNPPDYITVIEKTPILDLTFEAIGSPSNSTILSLENVELSDEYFEVYYPGVVNDGFVSIYEPEVVNQNPIADAGGPYSDVEGKTITFDGTGSYDPDGTIVSYEWSFGDGGTGTGSTPSHAYASTGTYTVNLTVTDNEGATGSDTTTTTISKPAPPPPPPPPPPIIPQNVDPVANAGSNQTAWVNRTIYFSGVKSRDPDGSIVSYEWDFGDGAKASGVNVSHAYPEPGLYTVTLTVKDKMNAKGTDTCYVRVLEPPSSPIDEVMELVSLGETNYLVNASVEADTIIVLNTTDQLSVTVFRYEDNPYPEDPINATAVPLYADVMVSDPEAVVWPIYVEMTYTDEEIEGLDEVSLGIYYWINGTWRRCSDTGVYVDRNIVWTHMTRNETSGSPVTIAGNLLPKPAKFVLSDLDIEPEEAKLDEEVIISVLVTNIGEQPGSYNVTLRMASMLISIEDEAEVTLDEGESEIISFVHTMDVEGEYDVEGDGLTGSFKVIVPPPPPRPAEFEVSNLNLFVEIEEEADITIFVNVSNIGELKGTHEVDLKIDGEVVYSENVTLEGGETREVPLWILGGLPKGSYQVEVDGLTGSFTVSAKSIPFWIKPGNIIGIIIFIALMGAVAYLLLRKRNQSQESTVNENLDNT